MLNGEIKKDKVIIKEDYGTIYDSLYGTKGKGFLELDLIEACHLVEREKLEVLHKEKKLSFEKLYHYASEKTERFIEKYVVYKDLRERGLPVKIGYKGSDFKVYERGTGPNDLKNVKWVVFVESEDITCDFSMLEKISKMAENIRAVALLGVMDNDTNITYYTINELSV